MTASKPVFDVSGTTCAVAMFVASYQSSELNDRPRKTLGGITPAQAMQRLLSEPEKPIVATTG